MLTILTSLILLLNLASPVLASDEATESSTRKDFLESRMEKREELKTKRAELMDEFRQKRDEATEAAKLRREELKEKLAAIRDERKQLVVENLDERFNTVNGKWTTHWNNVLARFTKLLEKIEKKSSELASQGKDVSLVTTAVTNAKAAIEKAQEGINTQAGKTYSIDITDEENLGQNVKMVITEMHNDLKVVHSLIEEARKAVGVAIRALGAVAGSESTDE